jgi:hypothetical protein
MFQWYQSPELEEGHHSVTINQMRGAAVDYVVVTPGLNTLLVGQTLMVDNTYSGIEYSGPGWTDMQAFSFNGGNNGALRAHAFQNTTQETSTAGDSFTFSYTGESTVLTIVGTTCLDCPFRHYDDSLRNPSAPSRHSLALVYCGWRKPDPSLDHAKSYRWNRRAELSVDQYWPVTRRKSHCSHHFDCRHSAETNL